MNDISKRHQPFVGVVAGYTEGRTEQLPIFGYASLVGIFGTGFAALMTAVARSKRFSKRIKIRDLLLLGVATHKLTRILTKDWVTIPFRAPFTHYEGSAGGGEVNEKSRGSGLQRAVGDLVTCQFCSGPWVASALTAGMIVRPRHTRFALYVLTVVTISDLIHNVYAKSRGLRA